MSSRLWKTYTVKELVELKMLEKPSDGNHGGVHPKSADYVKEGVPFIMVPDLQDGKVSYENCKMISKKQVKTLRKGFSKPGDVLLTHKATIGKTAIVGNEYPLIVLTPQVTYYRVLSNIDNRYLKYYFDCDFFQNTLSNWADSGSTRAYLGILEQLNLPIILPSYAEQKSITNLLSAFDNKIELNNKIKKTLEQMIKAIFKRWFVDFEFPNEGKEPYKSTGGELIESELGMIPKGWKVCALNDVINIIDNRGKTPPQEPNKTIYPIIDVKALSGDTRVIDYNNCTKYVSKEIYNNWFRSGHPIHGDILISTVGSLAELKIFMGNTGCIAQNVVALRAKTISYLYLFELLKNIKNDLVSYDIGSVQPSIKVTHIIKHKILIPNNIVMDQFHLLINEITNEVFIKHNENVLLTSMRDSLLPKLMTGEIRVPFEEVSNAEIR